MELTSAAIYEANAVILSLPYETRDDGIYGPEATIVTAVISGETVTIGWVGDSRAYMLNNTGIAKVTQDHSYVQELLDNGIITDSEAENHPNRNLITRSVGTEKYVIVDTRIGNIGSGDMMLLCTDGLTNYISSRELYEIVSVKKEDAVEDLVKLAVERGGRDNISVVIARKEGENE
jgi:protein phosphatase